MMVSFLFWNLNGKPLEGRIARLARANDVDVLMLAECDSEPDEIVHALNQAGTGKYRYPFSEGRRIRIFTRFPE